jgi:L-ascorbate metabolism protein UlaG (beta-lactamase superfamily)
MRSRLLTAIAVLAVLGGCSTGAAASPSGAPPSPAASSAAVLVPASSSSVDVPSPSAGPPQAAPAGSIVLVYGPYDAQTEIIAPSGRRVLIDIEYPDALSSPPTASDILLTTHEHADHYDQAFVEAFPGRTLTMRAGTIRVDDVSITGILGAHHRDPLLSIPNYIFIVDVGGIRVAHLGDLGQEQFTASQLKALGRVDVVIAQLSNDFSAMDSVNRIGVDLVNQLHPRLLIPTHMMVDPAATAKMAAAEWSPFYASGSWITVRPDTLPETTSVLFMGDDAPIYAKLTGAKPGTW